MVSLQGVKKDKISCHKIFYYFRESRPQYWDLA